MTKNSDSFWLKLKNNAIWWLLAGSAVLLSVGYGVCHKVEVSPRDFRIAGLKDDFERVTNELADTQARCSNLIEKREVLAKTNADLAKKLADKSRHIVAKPVMCNLDIDTFTQLRSVTNRKFVDTKFDNESSVTRMVAEEEVWGAVLDLTNRQPHPIEIGSVRFKLIDSAWIRYSKTERKEFVATEDDRNFVDVQLGAAKPEAVVSIECEPRMVQPGRTAQLYFRFQSGDLGAKNAQYLRGVGVFKIDTDVGRLPDVTARFEIHPDNVGANIGKR